MKRVVKYVPGEGEIHITECGNKAIYLACSEMVSLWYIIVRGTKYFLKSLDNMLDKHAAMLMHGNLMDVLSLRNFTFYQFPDFRSAMEYYLEQTK